MNGPGAPDSTAFWTDWGQLLLAPLEPAARIPVAVWAMAALAVMLSHSLRASRLAAEWGPRIGLGWGAALRLGLLHNAAVCLLPFRSGELGYAWWLHQGWGVPLSRSAPSLLWLRLQDLLVLALLSTACLLAGTLALPVLPLGLGLLGTAAVAIGLRQLLRSRRNPARSAAGALDAFATHRVFSHPGLSRLAADVQPLLQALNAGLHSRGGWRAWWFTVLNWCTRLAVQGGLLAVLLDLPLSAALLGAAGGEWGSLLPLQLPAGVGPQQGAVWLALQSTPVQLPGALTVLGAALCVQLFWVGVGLAAAAAAALWPGDKPWRRTPSTACPAPLPQARGLS